MKAQVWMSQVIRVDGIVRDEDLLWLRQKKFLKVMDLSARQALRALYLALKWGDQTGLTQSEDCGVVVSIEKLESGERDWAAARAWVSKHEGSLSLSISAIGNCLPPLALLSRLPNSVAGHVAREFNVTGPCWTSGEEGTAGLDAVIQAVRWIESGECVKVLVARVEENGALAVVLESSVSSLSTHRILSWSSGYSASSAAESEGGLKKIEDWDHWKDDRLLFSRKEDTLTRIVLEKYEPN